MPPPTPHPANAPGDFYVEDGCCITCGVPLDEAPEVFTWVEGPKYTSCVVAHQPQTADSIDRTLSAMWAGEVQCIRYRGALERDAAVVDASSSDGHRFDQRRLLGGCFRWKKWGFWALLVIALGIFGLNLSLHANPMLAVLGLAGPAVLFGVLNIGDSNKG